MVRTSSTPFLYAPGEVHEVNYQDTGRARVICDCRPDFSACIWTTLRCGISCDVCPVHTPVIRTDRHHGPYFTRVKTKAAKVTCLAKITQLRAKSSLCPHVPEKLCVWFKKNVCPQVPLSSAVCRAWPGRDSLPTRHSIQSQPPWLATEHICASDKAGQDESQDGTFGGKWVCSCGTRVPHLGRCPPSGKHFTAVQRGG
jgi:hypothetical protein